MRGHHVWALLAHARDPQMQHQRVWYSRPLAVRVGALRRCGATCPCPKRRLALRSAAVRAAELCPGRALRPELQAAPRAPRARAQPRRHGVSRPGTPAQRCWRRRSSHTPRAVPLRWQSEWVILPSHTSRRRRSNARRLLLSTTFASSHLRSLLAPLFPLRSRMLHLSQ
jgi:hypothetical protein